MIAVPVQERRPLIIRTKCKTCPRSVDPREMVPGGIICFECYLERLRAVDKEDFSRAVYEHECQECHTRSLVGYRHWDITSKSFVYLCLKCADEAIAKAGQYRGTPFGRKHKVE